MNTMLPESTSPSCSPPPLALHRQPSDNDSNLHLADRANYTVATSTTVKPPNGDDAPAQLGLDGDHFNANLDPKKMKRLLANRESARRSRLRKLNYVEKLKGDIVSQEAKLSLIYPQLSFFGVKREWLEKDNITLKNKLEALAEVKAYKEAEFGALMEERNGLNLMLSMMARQWSS